MGGGGGPSGIGAGVSYARLIAELGDRLPGLAMAARTIGSPQIRNRGTVGGNLGPHRRPATPTRRSWLPARRSSWPRLAGLRRVPVREFYAGPKQNVLAGDELIAAILVAPASGPEQFSKIGTRNAMVIAACSFALSIDPVAGAWEPGSDRRARRRSRPSRPRRSWRASWPSRRVGDTGRSRQAASTASPSSWRRRRARSTTFAAAPPTGARLCACSPAAPGLGLGSRLMRVRCTVNGEPREADGVWEGESLLYVLRERMGLPGRRTPASRASAARARSTSTASWFAPASCWPARPRAARW